MRLLRAAHALAARCAGIYALLGALAAVAGVIVCRAKVRKAVIVPRLYVVNSVGPGPATEMTRGAVEREDGRPNVFAPARWKTIGTLGAGPASRAHQEASVADQWERDNQRENWAGFAKKDTAQGRTDKAAQYQRRIDESYAAEQQQHSGGGGGGAPSGGGGCHLVVVAVLSLPMVGAVATYYT